MNIFVRNKKGQSTASVKEIRVRFSRGVLEPLDAVNLKEGEEVRITIAERSKGKGMAEALRASAGGWKNLIDREKKQNDYAEIRKKIFAGKDIKTIAQEAKKFNLSRSNSS